MLRCFSLFTESYGRILILFILVLLSYFRLLITSVFLIQSISVYVWTLYLNLLVHAQSWTNCTLFSLTFVCQSRLWSYLRHTRPTSTVHVTLTWSYVFVCVCDDSQLWRRINSFLTPFVVRLIDGTWASGILVREYVSQAKLASFTHPQISAGRYGHSLTLSGWLLVSKGLQAMLLCYPTSLLWFSGGKIYVKFKQWIDDLMIALRHGKLITSY